MESRQPAMKRSSLRQGTMTVTIGLFMRPQAPVVAWPADLACARTVCGAVRGAGRSPGPIRPPQASGRLPAMSRSGYRTAAARGLPAVRRPRLDTGRRIRAVDQPRYTEGV